MREPGAGERHRLAPPPGAGAGEWATGCDGGKGCAPSSRPRYLKDANLVVASHPEYLPPYIEETRCLGAYECRLEEGSLAKKIYGPRAGDVWCPRRGRRREFCTPDMTAPIRE